MSHVEAADVLPTVKHEHVLEAELVASLRAEQGGGTAASELSHSRLEQARAEAAAAARELLAGWKKKKQRLLSALHSLRQNKHVKLKLMLGSSASERMLSSTRVNYAASYNNK